MRARRSEQAGLGRSRRLATAAVAASVAAGGLAVSDAHASSRLAIAWDDPIGGAGYVGAVETSAPTVFAAPPLEVPGDGVLRGSAGRLFHVSRAGGVVSRIDPVAWTLERSYALPAGSEARDVALVGADTAYVSVRDASALLRLDLETGATTAAVDLAPLGVAPGVLTMETMLVDGGRLYVQLRRPLGSGQTSYVAVVDLASESIVDADPVAAGPQAIALVGTEPRFKMQIVPGTRRLMLSATGALLDAGGLETIDLESLHSEGLALEEFVDVSLNDLGPFAMLDADRGWYSGSTDIVLSSHLHPFTLSGGGNTAEAGSALFYFSPHIVHDAGLDRIFWPVPGGIRFFDATTGAEGAGSPALLLSGEPTDIELVASAPLPALQGVLAPLALAALLLAIGASRAPRARDSSVPDGPVRSQ